MTCFDIKCELLKDSMNRFLKTRLQLSRLKKKGVLKNGRSSSGKQELKQIYFRKK